MHPYSERAPRYFWKRYVPHVPWRDLPLAAHPKFRLARSDKIATAGSCFAQHITRYLQGAGCAVYKAEVPHRLVVAHGDEVASYELFSARYGNIYSARQCMELFKQAFGLRPVIEDFAEEDGRVYDLLRPNAVPGGFANVEEARADRQFHLASVRHMFRTADVFIFTLGLTECWYHVERGHTYPMCPGTARGQYQPQLHRFHNFSCAEVEADLQGLVLGLKTVNPGLKIILTVSPVPLVATYTDDNVLVASSYSKSVLRAATGAIAAIHEHVAYFPSYEIISHAGSFGQYLESDLRGVTERGVAHVMGEFLAAYLAPAPPAAIAPEAEPAPVAAQDNVALMQAMLKAECDEVFNDIGS